MEKMFKDLVAGDVLAAEGEELEMLITEDMRVIDRAELPNELVIPDDITSEQVARAQTLVRQRGGDGKYYIAGEGLIIGEPDKTTTVVRHAPDEIQELALEKTREMISELAGKLVVSLNHAGVRGNLTASLPGEDGAVVELRIDVDPFEDPKPEYAGVVPGTVNIELVQFLPGEEPDEQDITEPVLAQLAQARLVSQLMRRALSDAAAAQPDLQDGGRVNLGFMNNGNSDILN